MLTTARFPISSMVLSATLIAAACGRDPAPAPAAQVQAQPEYQPVATVRDIMRGVLDPSSAAIWESTKLTFTKAGLEERAPKTDDEWFALRNHALLLIEASNLLQMPGRPMARPGEVSSFPGIELGPEEIQALVDKDRMGWMTRAKQLHTAVLPTLDAINAKDAQKLADSGEAIDEACENCHSQYWYPNAPEPPAIP
jgi:hypothetical protein